MAIFTLLSLTLLVPAVAAHGLLNARGLHATASLDGTLRGGGACDDIVDCQANGECVSSTDVTCGEVNENWPSQPTLTLQCAFGFLKTITFASYGMPLGTCSSGFSINASCNAPTTMGVVTSLCVGQPFCTIPAYREAYGTDPCPNEGKRLAVSATCSTPAPSVVAQSVALQERGEGGREGDLPLPLPHPRSQAFVGSCVCDPAWRGAHCEYLDLPSVLPRAAGYHRTDPAVSSWGMHPVLNPTDGLWHTWVDENVNSCGIYSWISNSRVAHGISNSGPLGPYTYLDAAIENVGHVGSAFSPTNPHALVDPATGGLLLWIINASWFTQQSWINATAPGGSLACVCTAGNGTTTQESPACAGCWRNKVTTTPSPPLSRRDVLPFAPPHTPPLPQGGLCTTAGSFYTAPGAEGPWVPLTWNETGGGCNNPPPGVPPTGNNPSPFIFPNGSFAMVLCCHPPLWPVYTAPAWNASHTQVMNISAQQFLNASANKGGDPMIYGDKRGHLHVLSSWGWKNLSDAYTMVHTFSVDAGVTWRDTNVPPMVNVLVYDDGEVVKPPSVERPKVILSPTLDLQYLILAVDPQGKYWCRYDSSWTAVLPLGNVSIPVLQQ